MRAARGLLLLAAGLLWATAGCVSVKAPENIEIGGGSRPQPVDSSRIPETASHQEARRELRRAYANLRYLEHENERLAAKADKYKRQRDECEEQRDRYKDRLEKYEDD